jgi:pyruvate dehydrogenase E2 component (dihydrolipoamide acetyltransferase)
LVKRIFEAMIEFVMPKLGLTMEEGTILRWLKDEGASFEQGEPLVEVESDKAAVEVEAQSTGVLGKILVDVNTIVPVGQVIAYLLEPGEDPPKTWASADVTKESKSPSPAKQVEEPSRSFSEATAQKGGRALASPVARKLAEEKGVDLSQVRGTGPGGRITEKDLFQFLKKKGEDNNGHLYVPGRLKRITGERLSVSFKEAPHFYLRVQVIATGLVSCREKLLPEIEAQTGIRLTYTDLLLFILAKSIRLHPYINSCWEDGRIRRNPDINIGLAVAVDDGLIVPVIKYADQLKLEGLVVERERLSGKASIGKLSPDELEGGTFTLTNLGMLGMDEFSAILNPPQAAILAVGRIAKRAVVENDRVVARPTVNLTLTVDHRAVDGVEGARFLADLADRIENIEEHLSD